jgi:hypothetical protein
MATQQPDTAPGNYYVSVRDGTRAGLLVGPFPNDHAGALAWVVAAQRKAEEVDPWAAFYGFGTVRMKQTYDEPGILNEMLGLDARSRKEEGVEACG